MAKPTSGQHVAQAQSGSPSDVQQATDLNALFGLCEVNSVAIFGRAKVLEWRFCFFACCEFLTNAIEDLFSSGFVFVGHKEVIDLV